MGTRQEDEPFIVPGKICLGQYWDVVIFGQDLAEWLFFSPCFFTLPNGTIHPNLPHKCLRRNQVLPLVVIIILRDDPVENPFAILSSPLEWEVDWKGVGDFRIGNAFETCWTLSLCVIDSGISFLAPSSSVKVSSSLSFSGFCTQVVHTCLLMTRHCVRYDLDVIQRVSNRGRWPQRDGHLQLSRENPGS